MNSLVGGRFVIPELVISHFHLREGDVIADYGAGRGFFIKDLSATVLDTGKVYACEIQKSLVDALGDAAHSLGLKNVFPQWCDLEEARGIKIDDGELDAAILVNTLFMLEDKETAITEMARTVREGGKFFVVDWTESYEGLGPHENHIVSAAEATMLLEKSGFVLEREFPAGDHHYGLAFRKV